MKHLALLCLEIYCQSDCVSTDSRFALDSEKIIQLTPKPLVKLLSFQLLFNQPACSLRCLWTLNHLKISKQLSPVALTSEDKFIHHICKYHVLKLSHFSLGTGQKLYLFANEPQTVLSSRTWFKQTLRQPYPFCTKSSVQLNGCIFVFLMTQGVTCSWIVFLGILCLSQG